MISSKIDLGHIQLENQREATSYSFENTIKFLTANDQNVVQKKELVATVPAQTTTQQSSHNISIKDINSIKMEEFIDLSRYCHMDKLDGVLTKDVDELNTPIFELRNPFDFGGQLQLRNNINNHTDLMQQEQQQQQLHHIDHNYIINIKSETENVNNNKNNNANGIIIFNNRCENNINLMKDIKVEGSIDYIKNSLDISNNININNNNNNNKETVMWLQQDEEEEEQHHHHHQQQQQDGDEEQDSYLIDSMNPTTVTIAYTLLDDDDDKLITVDNFDDVLNIKTIVDRDTNNLIKENESKLINDDVRRLSLASLYDITPDESSTCSSSISSRSTNQTLTLNIDAASNYVDETASVIRTADVIDTIDEIESTSTKGGFNILQYINEEELQLATETAESIGTTSSILDDADDTFNSTFSVDYIKRNATNTTVSSPIKKLTRKRYEEDSDEEYLPPSSKRLKRNHRQNTKDLTIDSSSLTTKSSKRGRPPKRNVSISSIEDCYGDTPEARYRELRDKNNEASRKSRLKRKVKENELELEGDDLEERNRKLRVRVEELEKTVSRFRNNLMTLMLHKKS